MPRTYAETRWTQESKKERLVFDGSKKLLLFLLLLKKKSNHFEKTSLFVWIKIYFAGNLSRRLFFLALANYSISSRLIIKVNLFGKDFDVFISKNTILIYQTCHLKLTKVWNSFIFFVSFQKSIKRNLNKFFIKKINFL